MKTEKKMGGVPEKLHTNYPSRYAIGEKVTLDLVSVKITGCKIYEIRFTDSKVNYDIMIPLSEELGFTKIENVDSFFVRDEE